MFTWWVASFFILSSFFHLMNATLLRRFYLDRLELSYTPRVGSNIFSATVMIVIISYTRHPRSRHARIRRGSGGHDYDVRILGGGRGAPEESRRVDDESQSAPPPVGAGAHSPSGCMAAHRHALLRRPFRRGPGACVRARHSLGGTRSLISRLASHRCCRKCTLRVCLPRRDEVVQILSLVSKGLLGSLLIANVLLYSSFDEVYNR